MSDETLIEAIARAEAAEAKVTELSNDVHTLTGEASTYKRERDEIRAELARLRDLFRLDGEQHANHVKELTKAHEARITKYADELTRLRAKTEVSDAAFSAGVYAVADVLCASQYVNAPDASFVLTLAHHAFAAGIAAQAATPTEAK